MNSIQIPIGISDFERIRENNYCYIYNRDLLIDMMKEQKRFNFCINGGKIMGRYLNSSTSYVLYKGQTEQPYFVDKSQMLSELFPFLDSGNTHICITRPRRFGKTVMANMITAFLGKKQDSDSIFK